MRINGRTVAVAALLAAGLAAPAMADVAVEPAGAPAWSLPLILAATVVEVVALRLGFRFAWWKAAAAAVLGSLISYGVLMLMGLTDAPHADAQPTFLQSVFIAYPVLVFVEAPVVFAFAGRQGWRWGVIGLLVGNLVSAAALTASRPPPTPAYQRPLPPAAPGELRVPEPTAPRA